MVFEEAKVARCTMGAVYDVAVEWDYAHNDYAEALAETGLAGRALILSALGLFF